MHYLGFISLDLPSSEFITVQHGFYHCPHLVYHCPHLVYHCPFGQWCPHILGTVCDLAVKGWDYTIVTCDGLRQDYIRDMHNLCTFLTSITLCSEERSLQVWQREVLCITLTQTTRWWHTSAIQHQTHKWIQLHGISSWNWHNHREKQLNQSMLHFIITNNSTRWLLYMSHVGCWSIVDFP